jgi:hypothetical protein
MLGRQIVDLRKEQIVSCTLATLKTYSEPVWQRRKRKAATVTATTAKAALRETGLSTTPLERWRRLARLSSESPRLRFGQSSTVHAHLRRRAGAEDG